MTVYEPGDKLFERALEVGSDHRATPVIRTWTVLSVVDDPEYLGEDDRPLQVVTLRAFASKGALYEAEIAPYVETRRDGKRVTVRLEAGAPLLEALAP